MEKVQHIKLINTNMKRQAREFLMSVAEFPAVRVANMTDDRLGNALAEWCNNYDFGMINNGERIVLFPINTAYIFTK